MIVLTLWWPAHCGQNTNNNNKKKTTSEGKQKEGGGGDLFPALLTQRGRSPLEGPSENFTKFM